MLWEKNVKYLCKIATLPGRDQRNWKNMAELILYTLFLIILYTLYIPCFILQDLDLCLSIAYLNPSLWVHHLQNWRRVINVHCTNFCWPFTVKACPFIKCHFKSGTIYKMPQTHISHFNQGGLWWFCDFVSLFFWYLFIAEEGLQCA